MGRSISDEGKGGKLSPTMTVTVGAVSFFDGHRRKSRPSRQTRQFEKDIRYASPLNYSKNAGGVLSEEQLLAFSSFYRRHFCVIDHIQQPTRKKTIFPNCQNITPPSFLRKAYSVFSRIEVESSNEANT